MALNNLEDLLVEQLGDIYNAEHQILDALPKMEQGASSTDLKSAFHEHQAQTQRQAQRLEQVFDRLGTKPQEKLCKGMRGLIEEGDEILAQDAQPDVRDAALIGAAQKVEHYEISAYGTARTFAETIGNDDVADMLQETLDEEAATDEKLTRLAEGHINPSARI